MVALVKHAFTSVIPDNPAAVAAGEVVPSNWNADHVVDIDVAGVTGLSTELAGKQPLATVLTNTTAAFTTAQQTKLTGIATGATANSPDATLLNRANHTGTQAIGTVTGLQTALDGKLGTGAEAATVNTINGRLSAGTNITLGGAGTAASPYVINASGGGGSASFDGGNPAAWGINDPVTFDGGNPIDW